MLLPGQVPLDDRPAVNLPKSAEQFALRATAVAGQPLVVRMWYTLDEELQIHLHVTGDDTTEYTDTMHLDCDGVPTVDEVEQFAHDVAINALLSRFVLLLKTDRRAFRGERPKDEADRALKEEINRWAQIVRDIEADCQRSQQPQRDTSVHTERAVLGVMYAMLDPMRNPQTRLLRRLASAVEGGY